ncbi:ABCG2, partial [Symbiodinium natans]
AGKKYAPHKGTIHINGRPRDMLWNRISAYVPQDDLMFAHLTVEEVLRFHANLKTQRPARITRQMDHLRIEAFLQAFGLHDIRKSYVGNPKQGARGISGGQRRRLSLVKGVACGARVMFCDEPTSGLSATDAELCVRYMRWLAHKYSVLIIMSIHQPRREVARLFDDLILLTSSPGRAVYQGPMRDLSDYAAKVGYPIPLKRNPTDFCMDLITPGMKGAREDEFVRHFQAVQAPTIEEVVRKQLTEDCGSAMDILRAMREPMQVFGVMPPLRNSKYGVPFRTQVRIVAWRQFKLRYRDKTHLLMDLAAAVAKALILGLAFYDIGAKGQPHQLGFFFFVLMACSIDQVKTMPAMIAERNIMKLETSEALYSEWAYILPVTLMSAMQAIVTHFVFIALLWPFVSFPVALFGHVWFWSLMVNTVMDSLYVMLSGIAKDATIAQIMSLPFLLVFMLYNGFTVTRTTCPKWLLWALNVSPVAYAMEAITMAAARICVYGGPPCGKDGFYPGILVQFSYEEQTETAIIVMCVCILLFRAIHMVCLKFLNNIQR